MGHDKLSCNEVDFIEDEDGSSSLMIKLQLTDEEMARWREPHGLNVWQYFGIPKNLKIETAQNLTAYSVVNALNLSNINRENTDD